MWYKQAQKNITNKPSSLNNERGVEGVLATYNTSIMIQYNIDYALSLEIGTYWYTTP